MEQFLLNGRAYANMSLLQDMLPSQIKYMKKYDLPTYKKKVFNQKSNANVWNQNDNRINKKFACNQNKDQRLSQIAKKVKNLLSSISFESLNRQQSKHSYRQSENPVQIKKGYFTSRGMNRSLNQKNGKGSLTMRTCRLVSPLSQDQFRQYNANYQIKYVSSPRCFISPHKQKSLPNSLSQDKQNILNGSSIKPQLTIRQRVDQQMQNQIKKRKIMCRTAHMKSNTNKKNGIVHEDQIVKAQARIYSEMRDNRKKAHKMMNSPELNIERNKPFFMTGNQQEYRQDIKKIQM